MQNKDKYRTLEEAQWDYFKYQDNCIKNKTMMLTFQGWLFSECEEKSEKDYEHWHNYIVED